MKLFGQYLLEKKLIKEEDLLLFYLEQMSAAPSIADLCYRNAWLAPRQILSALGRMAGQRVDFKSACQELGFWSDGIEAALDAERARLGTPVCKLLVERKLVSLPDLVRALDEYLAESAVAATPVADADRARIDSADYGAFFDEASQGALARLFDSLSRIDDASQLGPLLSPLGEACEILSSIRGAARLAHAPESEKLSRQLSQWLAAVPVGREGLSVGELKSLGSLGVRAVQHLTGLRAAILATGNEAAHLEKSVASLRALASEILEARAKRP